MPLKYRYTIIFIFEYTNLLVVHMGSSTSNLKSAFTTVYTHDIGGGGGKVWAFNAQGEVASLFNC